RYQGAQVERHIHPDLTMSVGRKKVDDSIQRLVGIVSVQSGQTQVAGFGEGQCMFHGFTSTNLTNKDNVGRLPQGILQRDLEGVGIDTHFTLGDDTTLVLVDVFDWVFNGDDVATRVTVTVANHGSE